MSWQKPDSGSKEKPIPEQHVETQHVEDTLTDELDVTYPTVAGQQKNNISRGMPVGLDWHHEYTDILVPTESYENNSPGITNIDVFWDHTRQRWAALYTAYDGTRNNTCLAFSDNLYEWEKYGSNPVFTGSSSGWDQSIKGPFTWIGSDGTFYQFYIGFDSTGNESGTSAIGIATSTDLVNWSRHSGNPILETSSSGWRSANLYKSSIVYDGGVFYQFLNAKDGSDGKERIGYATTTNLTGDWSWATDDNPVLDVGSSGAWDDSFVGDPYILRYDDQWVMHYWGNPGKKCGLAIAAPSDFPATWTKHPQNPLLEPAMEPGIGDKAIKPVVVAKNGDLFNFYMSRDPASSLQGIHLARTSQTEHTMVQGIDDQSSRTAISSTSYSTVDGGKLLFPARVAKDNGDLSDLYFVATFQADVSLSSGESAFLTFNSNQFPSFSYAETEITSGGNYTEVTWRGQMPSATDMDQIKMNLFAKVTNSNDTILVRDGTVTLRRPATT